MGTRSRTDVLDKNGNVIISIYRQNDGDFDHHGNDLFQFFTENELARKIFNDSICPEYNSGMEDLAGKLFCFLCTKTKEIMPASPSTNNDFAYEYRIRFDLGWGLSVMGRQAFGSSGYSPWKPVVEKHQLTKFGSNT